MTRSTVLVLALMTVACGGGESEPVTAGAGGGTSCPAGQLPAADGSCLPAGIQGCADVFMEEDGLCHPSIDKCAPGTIPKFAEGCVPVGIASCAELFMEADGVCYPSPDKCPAGTFPVPSEGCVPIDGDGCGTDPWGNIADAPNTVWVDPTYAGGDGDGSQQKPVTTIADALMLATSGGRIALAAGDYAEPVTLDMPLELIGRCPSMVTISGTRMTQHIATPVIVFATFAMGARVSNLRISGAGIGVLAVGGDVELSGVHIHEATHLGILPATGMLRVERSLVEGTLPLNGLSGHGVEPQSGGEVTLHQSALVANHEIGLLAAYSASVTVSDSVIAKTIPNMSGMFGRGVDVAAGVTLSIEASALVDNHELALGIGQTGTTVTVTESVIARTAPRPSDQSGGRGIQVQGGGTLTLSGSVVSENHDSAVTLAHPGSIVTIEESLVTKTTAPPSDLTAGRGIVVQDGASLVLDNSTLADNRRTGIVIASGDPQRTAFATVTASLIERTLPDEQEGAYGAGIVCTGSGGLLLSGSAVRASQTSGVLTANGATSDIISALVDDVAPGRVHTYEGDTIVATFEGIGDGIVTAFGARANVNDTLVSGAGRAGLLFETSEGALRSVHTRESSIGLVIQGEPGPDWQHDSNVFDGFDQRVVTDGELPVPQAPPLPTE